MHKADRFLSQRDRYIQSYFEFGGYAKPGRSEIGHFKPGQHRNFIFAGFSFLVL